MALSLLSIFSTLAIFVAFAALALIIYLHAKHQEYNHIPGPPRSSFFFGHIPDLLAYDKKSLNMNHYLYNCYRRHGAIFNIWLLHKPYVFVVSPRAIRELLISCKDPKETEVYGLLAYVRGQRFVGNGLFTDVNYDTWIKRHRIVSPAFKRAYLRRLMKQFNASTDLFLDRLQRKAKDVSVVALAEEFPRVTLDSIAKVALNLEINAFDETASEVSSALRAAFLSFREAITNPLYRFGLSKHDLAVSARAGAQKVRAIMRKCIEKRLAALKGDNGTTVPNDILTLILHGAASDNCLLTLEDLIDDFVTFFVAGTETTASLLSFTILELSEHPTVYHRLRDELRSVLGDSVFVSFDHVTRLQYLGQVFKEVMRRHPPAPGSGRELRNHMIVDGYRLPVGTILSSATYVSHHAEINFKNPFNFDPERFAPNRKQPSVLTYYPFSIGPRSCVGRNFAQIEVKVVLSRFLHDFDFSLLPGQPRGDRLLLTLVPQSQLLSTLKLRSKVEKDF